jgi:hypothetical protein
MNGKFVGREMILQRRCLCSTKIQINHSAASPPPPGSSTRPELTSTRVPDTPKEEKVLISACGIDEDEDEDDDDEWEEMIMIGPDGNSEWGGPKRGGRNPEPTRFGDWERQGRCTDF